VTIDLTRPHIGRVYDYVLGGTYNYEADRIAAREIIARIPSYPRMARLNRSFLGYVGQRWAVEGRTRVLDLGSGLPHAGAPRHAAARRPDSLRRQ
jgi:S-adenosyl methyltransferase